jgi:hypothetical protein
VRPLILVFLLGAAQIAWADESPAYKYSKLPLFSTLTEIPQTALDSISYSFTKESLPYWAAIIGSTAVLYHYDADIYQGGKNDGQRWGLGNADNTKTVLSGFGFDLVRLPSDTASCLYFLGDGWTHTIISLSFFADGYFTDNPRPYNTGLEIIHGMITSTLLSQVVKRATGRESPNMSTEERGRWRPFPSVTAYQDHTAQYDAFPSGHIMTATLSFTVINENYPEYFWYIAPIEGLWLTALGFEMVNNGVHWASDYPLGIAMGYVVGKMSARLAERNEHAKTKKAHAWTFFPTVAGNGPQMNAVYVF